MKSKKRQKIDKGFTLIEVAISSSLAFICILLFVKISEPVKNALQIKMNNIQEYDSLITFIGIMDTYVKNSSTLATSTIAKLLSETNSYSLENEEAMVEASLESEFDSDSELLIFKKYQQVNSDWFENIWAICGQKKEKTKQNDIGQSMSLLQQKIFICGYPHQLKSGKLQPIEMFRIKTGDRGLHTLPYSFAIFPHNKMVQMKVGNEYIVQFGFISHIYLIQ